MLYNNEIRYAHNDVCGSTMRTLLIEFKAANVKSVIPVRSYIYGEGQREGEFIERTDAELQKAFSRIKDKYVAVPWEGVFRIKNVTSHHHRAEVICAITGYTTTMRLPSGDQYFFNTKATAKKFIKAYRAKVMESLHTRQASQKNYARDLMENARRVKVRNMINGRAIAEFLANLKNHDDYSYDNTQIRDLLNTSSISTERRTILFDKFIGLRRSIGNDLYVCPDCGEVEPTEDWHETDSGDYVCENCIENYYYSNYHNHYIHTDNARPYYDSGRSYHNEDADDWYNVNCDYDATYHDGAYFDYDTYCALFEDEDEDDDGLNGYHDSHRNFVERASDKRYVPLGVELEVYANDRANAVSSLRSVFDDLYLERDGSLDDYHGFEIITQPLGKSEWASFAPKLLDNLMGNKVLGYNHPDENSYGIHISVNREYLSPLQEARMSLFLTATENEHFVKVIAQRNAIYGGSSSVQFGAFDAISQKIRNIGGFAYSNNDKRKKINGMGKYSPLNLKADIAECRIFQSTLHPQSFMKNLEFMWALVEWTSTASATGSTWMHTDFIKWLAARPNADTDFGNLIAYLRRPTYIVKRGNGSISNTWLGLLPHATTKSQPTEEIEEEALAA